MSLVHKLLSEYGESHQNNTNKLIHWICVPLIFFSIVGLIMAIPFIGAKTLALNWATIVMILVLIYYLRLSLKLFLGFIVYGGLNIWIAWELYAYFNFNPVSMAYICFAIFFLAWIGQFIGHKIEGVKPSFFKDIQFLLIGPAWLMSFVFRKLSIEL